MTVHWNQSSVDSHSLWQLYRHMNKILLCTRIHEREIWSLRGTKTRKYITLRMIVSVTQYKWQSTEHECKVCSHKQKFVYSDVLLWEKASNFVWCDGVFLVE
jgi:hypothetical protein